jgi:hypothetical protein
MEHTRDRQPSSLQSAYLAQVGRCCWPRRRSAHRQSRVSAYTIVAVLGGQVDSTMGGEVQPFIMLTREQIRAHRRFIRPC